MISHRLAYVTLVVDDIDAITAVLTHAYGLTQSEGYYGDGARIIPIFSVGETTLAVCELDDPFVNGYDRPGVHHIALAVDDPQATAHTAVAAGLPLADETAHVGLNNSQRFLISPDVTQGIRTYVAEPVETPNRRDGMIERIDHLGIASADCDGTVDTFVNRLGLSWEDTETDIETVVPIETFVSKKYGVTQITRPPQMIAGVRADFITIGDCELEVIQEIDAEHAGQVQHGLAGTTAQDKGAIAKYVARRGPGLHHVAFKVSDINAGLAALSHAGLRLIDQVGRAGGRRSQIGFIHPQSLGGVLTHLVERDVS